MSTRKYKLQGYALLFQDTLVHIWKSIIVPIHFHRIQCKEHRLTPLQATDPGGTITMVTASGRSFTRQIKTEDTTVQETNPATSGQLVLGNWSIALKWTLVATLFYGATVIQVVATHCHCFMVYKSPCSLLCWCHVFDKIWNFNFGACILDSNKIWLHMDTIYKYHHSTKLYHEFVAVCIVTSAQYE